MNSEITAVLNIGSEEMISINGLAEMIIGISGKNLTIENIEGPVGVQGRNSDNRLIKEKLDWWPKYSLEKGIAKTYDWIHEQMTIPSVPLS
tara:strand:- start:1119 stop:1391 length:273 start_codon:yes stop_codon:yes gene_type:complete